MVKQFPDNNNNQRGGGGFSRGRGNASRGGFNRNNADAGPPSYVVPFGTYLHKSEGNFVVTATDMSRFPKFNRAVYLESKAKVGTVDEIFGPLKAFYFSVKPVQGVDPAKFTKGQVLYMSPEDLLSTEKFTKPQVKTPRAPGAARGGFGGQRGGFGGQRGGFGGQRGGQRGGFGNRGSDRGRGGFGGRGRGN